MASEWKRSTWVFSPIALSHTYQHIINAIHTVLTDTGWAIASWSNGGALGSDNYYVRTDRYRLDLDSTVFGPTGNQVVSVVGGNLSKADITGGAFGTAASTKGHGYVQFSAQPVDGNTVTLTDGTLTKTFEFDTGNGVVGSNIPVVVGTTVENTIENLAAAIAGVAGFKIVATPHWHWWYTGDNYYQHGGLRVNYASNTVRVSSFLENVAKTGAQIVGSVQFVPIAYDMSQTNNFLFIAGEDGFYIEVGVGAYYNSIAHGMIMAYYPDEALSGTRDRERTWTCQGLAYSLLGLIGTSDRNFRFVGTVSDRNHHTGRIAAYVPRGSDSVLNRNLSDNRGVEFGPRDHWMTAYYRCDVGYASTFLATLGLMQSNFDDLYRVSPLAALQGRDLYSVTRWSTGTEVVGSTTDTQVQAYDIRNALRRIPKFGVCSSYLLPWNNITDKRTGIIYRVAQVADGGRTSNLCIAWPDNSNVTTIAATP